METMKYNKEDMDMLDEIANELKQIYPDWEFKVYLDSSKWLFSDLDPKAEYFEMLMIHKISNGDKIWLDGFITPRGMKGYRQDKKNKIIMECIKFMNPPKLDSTKRILSGPLPSVFIK